jgi:hypothetical protein
VNSDSKRALHLAAAYLYVAVVMVIAWIPLHRNPPPRFGDLYLIPIALICARYSWRSAAFIFTAAYVQILAMIWPMPADKLIGMILFATTDVFLLWVIEKAKSAMPATAAARGKTASHD